MSKLNIVIISKIILPTIAPRAFRATELAKAFAKKGHNVTLLASLGSHDYRSFENKYNLKVEDIGTPFIATRNSDGRMKLPLWKLGFIFFLRKILDFPDILLFKNAKKAIITRNDFDLLITIAMPYSINWGVSLINKEKRNFKTWVSDCGDPFMGNTFSKPMFYFKYLEHLWSKKTDFITVPIEAAKDSYYNRYRDKIKIIPQGFNFDEVILSDYKKNKVPTFIYAGLFYPDKRDPTSFLTYLASLDIDFRFIIYTSNSTLLKPFSKLLKNKMIIHSSIAREDLILEMSKADFLINISNKGTSTQVPSKLIDYSISKRPILEISSEITEIQKQNFHDFINGNFQSSIHLRNIEAYDASFIAEQFLNLHTENGL